MPAMTNEQQTQTQTRRYVDPLDLVETPKTCVRVLDQTVAWRESIHERGTSAYESDDDAADRDWRRRIPSAPF